MTPADAALTALYPDGTMRYTWGQACGHGLIVSTVWLTLISGLVLLKHAMICFGRCVTKRCVRSL